MQLGMHLRELSRLRAGLAVSFLIAVFVTLSAGYRISVLPPGLTPRTATVATASAEILVDTRTSIALNSLVGADEYDSLATRAVLLGNLIDSAPVRIDIARRTNLDPGAITVNAPLTPAAPAPIAANGNQAHTTDLVKSLNQYILSVQTPPGVPIIDIDAQAPSPAAANSLAAGAVYGLNDYLAAIAAHKGLAPTAQLSLTPLGFTPGTVINGGFRVQVMVLAFIFSFALCAAAAVFMSRIRRGWRSMSALSADAVASESRDRPAPAR